VQIPVSVHVHVVVDVGAVVVDLFMPGVLGDLVVVVREGASRNTIISGSCGSYTSVLLLLLALWRKIPNVLRLSRRPMLSTWAPSPCNRRMCAASRTISMTPFVAAGIMVMFLRTR
jgi:hypothetical protein